MKLSVYQEVTEWIVEYRQPNHTYLFDGKSNVYAMAKWHGKEIEIFDKPRAIDTRRRKFVKAVHKGLEAFAKTVAVEPEEKANNVTSFEVTGSSGKTYLVKKEFGKLTCNCVGYMYRNKCKHIESFKEQQ
jgi:hypothetical protein